MASVYIYDISSHKFQYFKNKFVGRIIYSFSFFCKLSFKINLTH